ncbi:MAG: hypothetical protein L0Y64_06380 [Myxococcaceae bacterium]|nr:hypothetical protein [Myxococcaceae bacterium]
MKRHAPSLARYHRKRHFRRTPEPSLERSGHDETRSELDQALMKLASPTH